MDSVDDSGNTQPEPARPATPPAGASTPWPRPRLQRVGNLRDLVGKSGVLPDAPGPNPRRP